MKTTILCGLAALAAGSLLAADSTPKDDVANAVKKLGENLNYSWRTIYTVPEDAPFKLAPMDGKTEKGGCTWFGLNIFDNKVEALIQGDKGAVTQEGAWKSLEEVDKQEGPGQFLGMLVRNLKTPAKEATELAGFAKELKLDAGAYSGDLTAEGAKIVQTIRGRDGARFPEVSNTSGSVKFWLKEGALTKYEYKVKGTMSINGDSIPNERTTSVEIKAVGTTKIEVPEEAQKKLSPAPAKTQDATGK